MKGRGDEGPPRDTPMYNHYKSYKTSDDKAYEEAASYSKRLKNPPTIMKSVIKADKATFRRDGTPRTYVGEPAATREWHAESAGHAQRTSRQFTE